MDQLLFACFVFYGLKDLEDYWWKDSCSVSCNMRTGTFHFSAFHAQRSSMAEGEEGKGGRVSVGCSHRDSGGYSIQILRNS